MALADFFARSALAASQVLSGFNEEAFAAKLADSPVGVTFTSETGGRAEGRALVDLTVRLLARLYPTIALDAEAGAAAADLARKVNPNIDIVGLSQASAGIVIGPCDHRFTTSVFAGSDGWDALIDNERPQRVGTSNNPLGAGAAASLAAGAVFRHVFAEGHIDSGLRLSTYLGNIGASPPDLVLSQPWLLGESVLVGAGAIGNAAVWALTRCPAAGTLHVVDDETIDLGNLQRYVLAFRADEEAVKVEVAAKASEDAGLDIHPHEQSWAQFLAEHGFAHEQVLLALDSAQARRDAQASLPHRIVNAWTQPGDLGVSNHSAFGGDGACVACLYLADAARQNEDEIVAVALGVPGRVDHIRSLLHTGEPVDSGLLHEIAAGLGQPPERVLTFAGRPIRDLYVEGICGGALLPLGAGGRPSDEVHVPLAHQSALAGVLLAAAAVRQATAGPPDVTRVTRLNVLRPVGMSLSQPSRRRGDRRCICEDRDFADAYAVKWQPV
jgi:hypothetical protein